MRHWIIRCVFTGITFFNIIHERECEQCDEADHSWYDGPEYLPKSTIGGVVKDFLY